MRLNLPANLMDDYDLFCWHCGCNWGLYMLKWHFVPPELELFMTCLVLAFAWLGLHRQKTVSLKAEQRGRIGFFFPSTIIHSPVRPVNSPHPSQPVVQSLTFATREGGVVVNLGPTDRIYPQDVFSWMSSEVGRLFSASVLDFLKSIVGISSDEIILVELSLCLFF